MRILITGNKGYIASAINCYDGFDLKDGVDVVTYRAKMKYDVVIHTAAKTSVIEGENNPNTYYRTNVRGTQNILSQHPEAHFIYLSTASVYGEGLHHTIKSPTKPKSVYAHTKLKGEEMIRKFAKSWAILRLTNVIGEGIRGEPNVYQIFQSLKVLPIYGDGLQTRDFIDVKRVREIIMHFTQKQGLYNVGSGQSITILELAKGFNKPLEFFPARKGEIRNFGVDDAFDSNSQSQ